MGNYQYKAIDSGGKTVQGKVEAASKDAVKFLLRKKRLRPVSIKAVKLETDMNFDDDIQYILGTWVFKDANGVIQIAPGGEQKPDRKDIIVFTKQFSTMIGSGVPLIQAINVLSKQQRVAAFGRDLAKIRHAVENGATLSESMEAFPKYFDDLYCNMVKAGEASGNIDTILMKLTSYIEKSAKIAGQVKSAMTYPAVVVAVTVIVVSILLWFVVPTFAQQYEGMGKELPGLTQFMIDASNWFKSNILYLIGSIFLLYYTFQTWKKTEKGAYQWDAFLLKVPGIGNLILKVTVGRFCTTMSTMLSSGVNLLDALTICASASGNKIIEEFILGVRKDIEQGSKLSDPLAKDGIFPQMVVSMVAVGESTGALDEMLEKVSEFYEDEVDLAVKGVLGMIEPIMIVGIGSIVGFIMIAMYLPVFSMAS